jgi:1-acyl-sn-glycerol-3-phosphate acyltransferase
MSILHKTNLFIRSLLFTIIVNIYTIFYSFFCVLIWPLSFHARYKVIAFWTGSVIKLLKYLCYVDYKVSGLENIPANHNGIIMSKHQSAWETFFLPTIFHEPAIIIKRELLWIPFFGWGLAIIEPIAINRNDQSSAMSQIINKGRKCLAAGRWILVFPEGTRIAPGKVGKYRLGGARLATETGYPIIPVAHNAGVFWSKRKFIKKPGTVQVVIGPLIETKDRKPEEVLKEVKDWIETTMCVMPAQAGIQ